MRPPAPGAPAAILMSIRDGSWTNDKVSHHSKTVETANFVSKGLTKLAILVKDSPDNEDEASKVFGPFVTTSHGAVAI